VRLFIGSTILVQVILAGWLESTEFGLCSDPTHGIYFAPPEAHKASQENRERNDPPVAPWEVTGTSGSLSSQFNPLSITGNANLGWFWQASYRKQGQEGYEHESITSKQPQSIRRMIENES